MSVPSAVPAVRSASWRRRYAGSTGIVLNDRAVRGGLDPARRRRSGPRARRGAVRDLPVLAPPARHLRHRDHDGRVQEFRYRGRATSACPASCTSCIPTRRTTAARRPTPASPTASSMSSPSSSAMRSEAGRSPSSPSPSRTGACDARAAPAPRPDRRPGQRPRNARGGLRDRGGAACAGGGGDAARGADRSAGGRARAHYLAAHASTRPRPPRSSGSRAPTGYAIARQFRRAYGTSPDRYRTMRRLALARTAIEEGVPLARAAADCRLCRPEPHDPPVRARLRADARAVGRDRRGLWPSLGRVIFAARPPDSGAWRVLPSDASAAPRNTGSVADTTAGTSPGG